MKDEICIAAVIILVVASICAMSAIIAVSYRNDQHGERIACIKAGGAYTEHSGQGGCQQ